MEGPARSFPHCPVDGGAGSDLCFRQGNMVVGMEGKDWSDAFVECLAFVEIPLCLSIQYTVMTVRGKEGQQTRPDKGRLDIVRASGLLGQVQCMRSDKSSADMERGQDSGSGRYST